MCTKKSGWKRKKVRRKSNKKNTRPSWKQLGNEVLCLLLPRFPSSSNVAPTTKVSMVIPTPWWNQQTLLCCMEMCLISVHARQIKSWYPNTLRKIQTWISTPRLISVAVFDPTKILDLNFRGGFVSIQAGQLGWTCMYMCVCRHLHTSCTPFVFLSCSTLYENCFLSFINGLLWVLDVTGISKYPPPLWKWGVNYPILVPTDAF